MRAPLQRSRSFESLAFDISAIVEMAIKTGTRRTFYCLLPHFYCEKSQDKASWSRKVSSSF